MNNKACGIDENPAELIKCAGERINKELDNIYYEMLYFTEITIDDFLKSIIVAIPKKNEAIICEELRTLNFNTRVSKIIKNRIEKAIDR